MHLVNVISKCDSQCEEVDPLDEILELIKEEEKIEEQQKQIELAKRKKHEFESIVSNNCHLRIDPSTRRISKENLNIQLTRFNLLGLKNLLFDLRQINTDKKKRCIVMGILAVKMINRAQNGKKYLLIKISDFLSSASFFIFDGEVGSKFYKVQCGTILAIIDPKMYKDRFRRSFLTIKNFDCVLVIGKSIDFGFCGKSIRNTHNGTGRCTNYVNKTLHSLCDYHRNQKDQKSQMSSFNQASKKFTNVSNAHSECNHLLETHNQKRKKQNVLGADTGCKKQKKSQKANIYSPNKMKNHCVELCSYFNHYGIVDKQEQTRIIELCHGARDVLKAMKLLGKRSHEKYAQSLLLTTDINTKASIIYDIICRFEYYGHDDNNHTSNIDDDKSQIKQGKDKKRNEMKDERNYVILDDEQILRARSNSYFVKYKILNNSDRAFIIESCGGINQTVRVMELLETASFLDRAEELHRVAGIQAKVNIITDIIASLTAEDNRTKIKRY